jgi:hypothetical protein
VAHGASRGIREREEFAEPRRGDISTPLGRTRTVGRTDVAPGGAQKLCWVLLFPRLAPWATICRPLRGLHAGHQLRLALVGRCPRLLNDALSGQSAWPANCLACRRSLVISRSHPRCLAEDKGKNHRTSRGPILRLHPISRSLDLPMSRSVISLRKTMLWCHSEAKKPRGRR